MASLCGACRQDSVSRQSCLPHSAAHSWQTCQPPFAPQRLFTAKHNLSSTSLDPTRAKSPKALMLLIGLDPQTLATVFGNTYLLKFIAVYSTAPTPTASKWLTNQQLVPASVANKLHCSAIQTRSRFVRGRRDQVTITNHQPIYVCSLSLSGA